MTDHLQLHHVPDLWFTWAPSGSKPLWQEIHFRKKKKTIFLKEVPKTQMNQLGQYIAGQFSVIFQNQQVTISSYIGKILACSICFWALDTRSMRLIFPPSGTVFQLQSRWTSQTNTYHMSSLSVCYFVSAAMRCEYDVSRDLVSRYTLANHEFSVAVDPAIPK